MGYEASFDFDLRIPAAKVEEMEKAYFLHEERTVSPIHRESSSFYKQCGFCEHFNDQWGDVVASEETPAPLEALASGTTRGDIFIMGCVSKRWRDWEEKTLEALAPFIQAGGTVGITGEDDYHGGWEFDGETMSSWDEESVKCSRVRELEAKEQELAELKAFLQEVALSHPGDETAATKMMKWIRVETHLGLLDSPIKQLARAAE